MGLAGVVDGLIDRHLEDGRTAGLAVVATDRDGVLLQRYRGWADVAARRPVDAGTVFQIGSITKVVTAVVAVQLHEAGRLDLHQPVRSYLPWLPEEPYATRTPHQLLSHTAGLPAGSDLAPASPYMAFVATYPPAVPPGDFHYSDAGLQVMGMVVAAVAGRPYPELVASGVLEPLGMTSSFPVITSAARPTMAVGYVGSPDDRPFAAGDGLAPAPYFDYTAGDGCAACTGPDLAAFARMLAAGGRGVLSPDGFDLLTTPVADTGDGEQVCYGVFTGDSYGYPDLNHGGNMVGYQAMMCVDRDSGIGVVVLLNGVGDPVPLARDVLAAMRQAHRGEPITTTDRRRPDPTEYVGSYRDAGGDTARVDLVDGTLRLDGTPLVPIADDAFAMRGSPYAVRFGRGGGAGSPVVEVTHGPGHWVTDGHTAELGREHPPQWAAYCGQYRAHKVFEPTFRVLVRNGSLLLAGPSGREYELRPGADPATFGVGDGRDVINFDTPADGHTLRAVISGCPYYRTL